MAIHYYCRHCNVNVGSLENTAGQPISTNQLGFDHLTGEERQEMISYDSKGDVHVKTICEDCQEALDRNPDFHQYESFIQ